MNGRIAVYPGTFDPLTRGHEDLVRRACGLFDHVIVGIARSPGKKPCFELEERVEMAREILAPVKNATLIGHGPTVMNSISMVGNDFAMDDGVGTCGKSGQSVPVGVGQPSLKIDAITVGGAG